MNDYQHQKQRRMHSTGKFRTDKEEGGSSILRSPVPRRVLYMAADLDGTYCIDEVVQRIRDGKVRVKYLHLIGGKLNLIKWPPSTEDIGNNFIDDVFMPCTHAPCLNGGRNRAKFMLKESLRDETSAAHQN